MPQSFHALLIIWEGKAKTDEKVKKKNPKLMKL